MLETLLEYVMFFRQWPWWVHAAIIVVALLFLLNSTLNIASKLRDNSGGSSKQTVRIGPHSDVSGDISPRSTAIGEIAADGGGDVVVGDKIEDRGSMVFEDNSTTINQIFVRSEPPKIEGVSAAAYKGSVTTQEGLEADVEVHVLWQEGAWHFGRVAYNRNKLLEYLRSPTYQSSLRGAHAIMCVGLASNWADVRGESSVTSLSTGRQFEVEETSDYRAFSLCKTVAQEAGTGGLRPLFAGFGLGFHVDKAPNKSEDRKQRSMVLLHVTTDPRRELRGPDLQSVLVEVMKTEEIEEFDGQRYSRVVGNKPICWSETFHGTFFADKLRC